MDPELEEQLRRAREGDMEAFGYVVAACREQALAVARRSSSDAHLAEDAVQEAFLLAFRELAGLRSLSAFPGWLAVIVRRCALRAARRRRPDLIDDLEPLEAQDEPGPGERAQEAELREVLQASLVELPPGARALIERYYLVGHSVGEVAAQLGLPQGTVKRRLFDARRRLGLALLGARPRAAAPSPRAPVRRLRFPL